jgi:hypothetical protein
VVGDGAGGYYVGGLFTEFGGQPVTNLSRIKPGGSVDAGFTHPDSQVTALAFSGGSVHAGGNFLTIGGQTGTPRLAELNATTGAVAATFTPSPSTAVAAPAVNGTTLDAGGTFTTIGGQTATPRSTEMNATTASSTRRSPGR